MSLNTLKNKYSNLPQQVKASIWFLICSVLQKGISVITTPIFTRLMNTAEYGQYNTFNSWLGIITVFVSLHMYNAVYTQGLIKFDKERNIFSSSLQGLTLTLTIGWTIIYILGKDLWNYLTGLSTVQMLAMLCMIWATSAFNFWAAEQRVNLTYKKLVFLTIAISIAKPVIGIIFVYISSDKVTARIIGIMLVEVIGYLGLFISQMKRGKAFYSAKFWKYSLLFCIPLVPHYLSQTVLNGADKIMIKNMVGDSESGIYALAYSLSQLMLMVNQALIQAVNPWIFQKIKDNKTKDIHKVSTPCLAIIGTMNIILICLAPEIVSIFAPEAYYNAIWIIPPVALSGFFVFAYTLFADFEFYHEKKIFITIATTISAILNIILNYIFINIFGYYAAGYTTLVCYILYTCGHYYFMRKIVTQYHDGVDVYHFKTIIMMAVLLLIIGFLMLLTYEHAIVRYSVIAAILIVALIFHKKILSMFKTILKVRKNKND